MNINVQRKIDRVVGTILCGILSLFHRRRNRLSQKCEPEKILVILLSEMGSLVLAYPMFAFIKERYPNSKIHILLFQRNLEVIDVMDLIPRPYTFTLDGDSFTGFVRDSLRVLWKIRRARIEVVIDCELFSRISSLYAILSGAAIRVGFHPYHQEGLFRGTYINRPVLYNPYHHIARQFITLVKAIDSDEIPVAKHPVEDFALEVPMSRVKENEIQSFREKMDKDFPVIKGKGLVLLYPGGGLLPIRSWPLSCFCLVAESLLNRGYAVAVIGLKEDKKLARAIKDYCDHPQCIDLTGYTQTVHELLLVLHIGTLLITNDGGPGHFAAMTAIGTIILYGPETPVLYGSLKRDAVHLYHPISCSPCLTAYNHRRSPCDGNNVCLKMISPVTVLAKAYAMLEEQSVI